AKDDVARVEVSLGFDPGAHPPQDYAELAEMADGFERAGARAPERAPGLRWTMVDEAVVFQTEREVMAPFTELTRRVDVAEGISLMADYLGGRRVPVSADADGRPLWQAERNIYLPQPNWVTAWGGLPIDVCKIELVERDPGRHRLSWRTVRSPNGSATYDDGSLTFEDTGRGTTVLRVAGRQLFALPAAWSAEGLALVPEVREPLVTESYRRFFAVTFDNLEACYEGRPFRVGRAPDGPDTALVTAVVRDLLAMGREGLGAPPENPRGRRSGGRPAPGDVDARGFAHFRGTR
ncbi:MAG TPA: hypothetical protein VHM65_06230, partial [Candidatus Lustribacter sp.]|nr:hypothetical protein [Candidatus Lustribacter sp.]